MNINIKGLILMLFALPLSVSAQQQSEKWSLKGCIDYAKVNNLDIRQSRLNQEEARESSKSARAAQNPSLSLSSSQTLSNSPYLESGDKTSYSGSYTLSSGATLYQGGKLRKNRQQATLNERIEELSINETENNLELTITEAFVQILYANESVKIYESTVEKSEAQVKRAKELLEVGSISKVDYAQLMAQLSNDKYSLVTSQTNLENNILQLKLILQLGINDDLVLDLPDLSDNDVMVPITDKKQVYEAALELMPEIKAGRVGIEAAELSKRIASSGYYPTVSLNASIGSGHSSGIGDDFTVLMKSNLRENLGVTISVPIYSRRENKTAVRKAEIGIESKELSLALAENTLLKTVETYYLDAVSSQKRYEAAEENLRSAEVSYGYTAEQFNIGMKNTVELLTEKDNYISAQQELMQAKYMAILNRQLLNFYQGIEINL